MAFLLLMDLQIWNQFCPADLSGWSTSGSVICSENV